METNATTSGSSAIAFGNRAVTSHVNVTLVGFTSDLVHADGDADIRMSWFADAVGSLALGVGTAPQAEPDGTRVPSRSPGTVSPVNEVIADVHSHLKIARMLSGT
ncbi:hypothetical protein J2W46_005839 [Paraburkholderia strydomiana]|nr:hypothetical protein [Paraburkholderia strydomiana]